MRLAVVLAVLFPAIWFQGCASSADIARENVERSRNLRLSMTKAEVLKVMGEPLQDESFCKPDIWYYFTGRVWGDGLVTADECLPLVFENGKLAGWGQNFLVRHRIRQNTVSSKNPAGAAK